MSSHHNRQRRGKTTPLTLVVTGIVILMGGLVLYSQTHFIARTAAALSFAGDRFEITQPTIILREPRVVLEKGTVSHVARHGEGFFGTLAGLFGSSAPLRLDDAVIVIDTASEMSSDEPGSLPQNEPQDYTQRVLERVRSAFERLDISNSTLIFRRNGVVYARFANVDAKIIKRRSGKAIASGRFSFRDRQVAFQAKLGKLRRNLAHPYRPLSLTLDNPLAALFFEGQIETHDGVRLEASEATLESSDLRNAALWLGVAWPEDARPRAFRASGQFAASEKGLAFQEATFRYDGNEALGALTLAFGTTKPSLEGTLAFTRLDLSVPAQPVSVASLDTLPMVSSLASLEQTARAFALPLFKDIDIDVRISAGEVIFNTFTTGEGAATLSVRDGRLLADIAGLDIGDESTVSGQVSLDFGSGAPELGIRGKLASFEMRRFTGALPQMPLVSGRADIVAEAKTAWHTRFDLTTWAGKARVEIPEGGDLGFDMNALMGTSPIVATAMPLKIAAGSTPLERLEGHFVLARGVLAAESFTASTDGFVWSAEGAIDLMARTLDLTLAAGLPDDPLTGTPSSGIRTAVKIFGDWAAPVLLPFDDPAKERHAL